MDGTLAEAKEKFGWEGQLCSRDQGQHIESPYYVLVAHRLKCDVRKIEGRVIGLEGDGGMAVYEVFNR